MATKQEQAKFEASKNRKWYPGKNLDRMSTAIINEMTDDKPLFGKIAGGIGSGLRKMGSKFGKFADKNLGTNKVGRYGLHASEAEVDAYSRSESIEDLPTKFQRTNPYGHKLGEIDMGDKTPYEYLMENPGDLRSYINTLGHYGIGGSTDKQNQFIKLFGTQEGGEELLNQYYHDASNVQQSFVKGAELENQIQNALNNPNPGQSGTSVLDLVGDVHFGRTGPVREAEFERGLKYGEDFQKSLSGLGKSLAGESDSRFPDPDAGAVYNRDPRIEGTDEGGF